MPTDSSLNIFRPVHADDLRRLGNRFDGGYVVHYPSLLDADCLVNYGVGYNTEFEKDFFKATGRPVLAFDPTLNDLSPVISKLKRKQFVPFLRHLKNYIAWKWQEPALKHYNITYVEEGIAAKNSGDYKTFAYHFEKYNLDHIRFIFKIDVEGAEYDVFSDNNIYGYLSDAVQIIAEFHYLENRIEEVKAILNKLSATHSLIHIHSNNHANFFRYQGKTIPGAIEVTLLANRYVPVKEYSHSRYPVPGLDQPCDRLQKDVPLDFFY